MRVHVADHPLITHKLTVLRDVNTPSPIFRALVEELMTLLAKKSHTACLPYERMIGEFREGRHESR